jgi:PAS domain S-box-containing protein
LSDRRARAKLIAALGVVVFAVVGLLGFLVWSSHQQALEAAEKTTRNYAAIIEARLDVTLRRVDAELQELAQTIPLAALNRKAVPQYVTALSAELRSPLIEFPELGAFGILDATGERLYTTYRDGKSGVQYGDRGYFQALRDNPRSGLIFSEVVISRSNGRPAVIAARALRDSRGVFRGAVLATIELGYFQKLFGQLDIGAGGIVSVYRSDDFSRVTRWPQTDDKLNPKLPPESPTRRALPPGTNKATIEIKSAADGTARIYSYDVLDRYPFFVSVGLAQDEVLANWRLRSLTVGLCGLFLLTLLGGLLFRLWRTEERLRTSEEVMRSTFEQAAVGIAHIQPETFSILVANERFCNLLGYTLPELIGRDVRILTPPEDTQARSAEREKVESGQLQSASNERRMVHKNGHLIWVNRSLSLVRDKGGEPLYFISVIEDITARKQAEIARAYLAAIVDSSDDAIVSRNVEGAITSWNRAAERLFGYSADEAIKQPVSILIPPERDAETETNRQVIEQGGAVVDLDTVRLAKGGRRIDVSLTGSPIYDADGCVVGVALIFRDISERKRKAALVQLLEMLARATNEAATPEAGLRACLDRICTHSDWQLGHVGLYAPGQTEGIVQTSFWYSTEPARFADFMKATENNYRSASTGILLARAARERRAVWIEDLSRAGASGHLRYAGDHGIVAAFVIPVFIGNEITGFLEFFATSARPPDADVLDAINSVSSQLARLIERGRAADKLSQLNAELEDRVTRRTAELEAANRELSSFSYTIAHDMRAPVRAINGFSEMVLSASMDKLDPVSLGHLRRVVAGSHRMSELIDDLLNLARLSRQEMARRDFNLSDVGSSVAAALAAATPAHRVELEIAPDLVANGDPGLMHAVLDNLLGNAWKFTAKTPAPRVELGSVQRDGSIAYYVRDNGAGFDMKYVHKLFAPFQRLHHSSEFEGTGIGLATVKRIIERHGGAVWAESAVNAGTTVYFTLGAAA